LAHARAPTVATMHSRTGSGTRRSMRGGGGCSVFWRIAGRCGVRRKMSRRVRQRDVKRTAGRRRVGDCGQAMGCGVAIYGGLTFGGSVNRQGCACRADDACAALRRCGNETTKITPNFCTSTPTTCTTAHYSRRATLAIERHQTRRQIFTCTHTNRYVTQRLLLRASHLCTSLHTAHRIALWLLCDSCSTLASCAFNPSASNTLYWFETPRLTVPALRTPNTPQSQRIPHPNMADQEEDFSSLPLPDRFTHKNWKVRKEAYEAAAKEFSLAASEQEPIVRQFISDASIWKGVVGDSNVAAQQEGLAALCAFLEISGREGCTR
jgi:hypothetical protein